MASNFQCWSEPFELTQYLRGRLYVYVDFLMANLYDDPQVLPAVVDFLKRVLKLIAAWLRRFPGLMRSVDGSFDW